MFSSSNTSINPFLASSPPFIINHTDDDHGIFLHNHNPLLTLPPNFSLIPTDAPFADAMINNNMGDQINNKKPTLKKDRQKIQTAQGLRDRRVRMSIGIAREFFDLQDTLGFDKASKTLEWLLTKSKTSIMELTHSGGDGGGAKSLSSASTSECEVVSKTTEEVVEIDGGPRTNKLRKAVFYTKESREKARERARARTRAKLCTTKMLSPPPSNFAYHDQNFVTSTTKDVFSSIISNNCVPRTHSSFYDMINTNLSTELEVYGKPWEAYNNNQTPH